MNDYEKINRGKEAYRITSDPVYIAAWKACMDDIYKQWVESPARDVEGRERLHMELEVLTRLKGKFTQFINEGKLAEKAIEDMT